jgi:hypothetical protein
MNTRAPFVVAAVAVAAVAVAAALLVHGGKPASAAKPANPANTAANSAALTPARSHGVTLKFVARDEPGNEAFDDLGTKSPNGPDIGDVLAFTQSLTVDGAVVGQIHVAAVGVDHQRHLSQANGTIVLAGGTVEVVGVVPMTPTFTLAVVGGTGRYADQTGTLSINATGTDQALTLQLNR